MSNRHTKDDLRLPSKCDLVPFPESWLHHTSVSGWRDNGDDTVTIRATTTATSPEGETYTADRIIRLTKTRKLRGHMESSAEEGHP